MISSLVTNADKAMTLLPVALLAMYLISGGPSELSSKPVLREVSRVNSVQWGLTGAAIAADAEALLLCNAPDGGTPPQCRTDWQRNAGRSWASAIFLIAIAAACATAAGLVLRLRRY